jgi:hypothetical protein
LQFKGKTKGQSFYPGKGMRDHETFEQLVAASNPALETVRAACFLVNGSPPKTIPPFN